MKYLFLLFLPILSNAAQECTDTCLNRVHKNDIEMIIEARKGNKTDPLPREMLSVRKSDPMCQCWDNIEWACAVYKDGILSNDEKCRADNLAARAKQREEAKIKKAENQKTIDDARSKMNSGNKLSDDEKEKLLKAIINK